MIIKIYEKSRDPFAGATLETPVLRDGDQRWEFILTWRGERHPVWVADWVYKHFRICKYGRSSDEQVFRITREGNLQSHNWGGLQRYDKWLVKHFSGVFPVNDPDSITIYVSTWNHCFSMTPPHGDTDYDIVTTFFFDPLTGTCVEQ